MKSRFHVASPPVQAGRSGTPDTNGLRLARRGRNKLAENLARTRVGEWIRFWSFFVASVAPWGCLLVSWRIQAEEELPDTVSYAARVWQTDDGLPQNSVYAISQTRDGYLWVGTQDGLARFDGITFTLLDDPAVPELKHGRITALHTTRDGTLWVGCDGQGLFRMANGVFTRVAGTNHLPNLEIRCLAEGPDGAVWMGTEGGLARYAQGAFSLYTVNDGLGDNSVRALCLDSSGLLRVATKRGLSTRGKDGRFTTLNFPGRWNANALRCVHKDRKGGLWVGSTDGLYCLEGTAQTTFTVSNGLPDRIINAVFEDYTGQVWIGTYGGLVRVIKGQVVGQPGREPLFGDIVHTIFEDREDNLWVGTRDGLLRLNPSRFTTYTTQSGLTANNVMSVIEDKKGTIWLGIWDGGLNALRDGGVKAYRDTADMTRDSVLSLLEARNGALWIGMDFGRGLDLLTNDLRISLPPIPGFTNAPVRVLHEDRHGSLWIGTGQGLSILKEGHYQRFTTAEGLGGDLVMALCEDRDGSIWIGTDGGLSRFHEGSFTNYTTREGLSHNSINALYLDTDGNLWIGTRGGGLNRFANGKFTAWTANDGLFSDEIYEILEDDFRCLWLSCRRGLFRVAKEDLADFERGAIKRITCAVFGRADGMLSVQCNGVAKPAGWKDRRGRLWFATIRGVVRVEPSIPINQRPPPVAIEKIVADRFVLWPRQGPGESKENAEIRIPAGGRGLEIHYTALSFQVPEKNLFSYRLEGADEDWTEARPERLARYNRLEPGRYRFHVIACNNDGVWNRQGAVIAFRVLPHFWQTWWFRVAAFGVLAALGALAYHIRVSRLRELENLRIQIAANLHDDVGARLTKVAMVTEHVTREMAGNGGIRPELETIAQTTREVTRAMDEVVWTINPKNDTLDNLANYIFQYAQEYFQNTGVRCLLDFPAQLPDREIATETRHNFFMIIKEALNNVLKHSQATEVRMKLEFTGTGTNLVIEDNGCGFEPERAHRGEGLTNMRQRVERLGGRLILKSQPGAGTNLRIELGWR